MKTLDFSYNGNPFRSFSLNNENWFIAKDICNSLELSDTNRAVERLDDDEKLTRKLFVSGQHREIWTVNESGLYSLVLTSTKPEAKAFKRWITHEVLPAISRAGKYTTEFAAQREAEIQAINLELDKLDSDITYKQSVLKDLKSKRDKKYIELRQKLKEDTFQSKIQFIEENND